MTASAQNVKRNSLKWSARQYSLRKVVNEMAWLKKYIDKYTLMLIIGIWNALTSFIPMHYHWSPESIALLITVGNLVIVWLALETNNDHEKALASTTNAS